MWARGSESCPEKGKEEFSHLLMKRPLHPLIECDLFGACQIVKEDLGHLSAESLVHDPDVAFIVSPQGLKIKIRRAYYGPGGVEYRAFCMKNDAVIAVDFDARPQ